MTNLRERIANCVDGEHIHNNFEIDRLENLFRFWARGVVEELRNENRGAMMGDMDNLHKIGKEGAYEQVLSSFEEKQ